MEKQLSYVLMLSLEQMALRRISVALYSEPRMLALTAKFQFQTDMCYRHTAFKVHILNEREWRQAIKDKISKLQLPTSLKNQMIPILQAVGSQIQQWKLIHEAYLRNSNEDFNVHALEKLCWTTAGAVDYRKTAEGLVRCDVVDIVTRFELACLYCLENYISLLWEELPEEYKKSFYNEEVTSRVETPHLQLFLPYILKKQSSAGHLPVIFSPRNSFEESALYGNKTLAEYCFWKLTNEERKASLVRTAKDVIKFRNYRFASNCEVLCYLLSLMTPEEQMGIFKELPCEVLRCFLAWPWQDLFLDIADVIWTFLPDSGYKDLVDTISLSFRSGYYLPNFFQNLFLRSPNEFRKRFVDGECQRGYLLREFLMNNDAETIKVIFRNIDAADRVRLVSSKHGLNLIYLLSPDWHRVVVFLREATLSKEDKERLKEAFIEFAMGRVRKYSNSIEFSRERFRNFFEFVEETDVSAENKRSSEDETLAKTKKLCCEKEENSTE